MSARDDEGARAPLVSVLLASRNGERFLAAALASLAAQSYRDVELVLVDDGSHDATGTLMRQFAAGHRAARVLRAEGVGLAGALALAAREARGVLLARQDDDDLSHPRRIERQVAFLSAHPEVAVLGTAAEVIDEAGAHVSTYPVPTTSAAIRRELGRRPPFVHGSVLMRRAAYEAAGGYRAAFRAAQDYDLWLRMPREAGFANLSEALYSWRSHAGGVFARARARQLYFSALARAFAEERAQTGRDSLAQFEAAGGEDAFMKQYARAGRLAFLLGETYVREGRVAEGRAFLRTAFACGGSRADAARWWLLSFAAALTPRARATRAGAGP